MGSRMIHLCVAKAILKRIPLKEELFILGNLAPDAYNPQNVGYAHTHFRIPEETMEKECIDLGSFLDKYQSHLNDHFVLGYYCHLISDNIWLKNAYEKYGGLSLEDREEAVRRVYRDYSILNGMLIKTYELETLQIPVSLITCMTEIEMEHMNRLLENLNGDFARPRPAGEPTELSYEETMEFINHAASECVKAIHVQGAKESGGILENPNH